MSLDEITLADLIRHRPPSGQFSASVKLHIEHREPVSDGVGTRHFLDTVQSVDVDLWVPLADPNPVGETRAPGFGGQLEHLPGFAVFQDDDEQVYLVLVVPVSDWPTEAR